MNKIKSLNQFFKLSIPMSGTPSDFQIGLGKVYKKNVCNCSLKTAIKENLVHTPILNLIEGNATVCWPTAVEKVFEHELDSKNMYKNGLVCVSSIDEIHSIYKNLSDSIKKNAHIIAIHSKKTIVNKKDGCEKVLSGTIDGIEKDNATIRNIIQAIDTDYFGDGLPIIVFQVDMIGEGINVNSFSWVITSTHSNVKGMQQIGRVLRKFEGKKESNIYLFFENKCDLKSLIENLVSQEITEITWGQTIDISQGSGIVEDMDQLPEGKEFNWTEINDLIISKLEIYFEKTQKKEFYMNLDIRSKFSKKIVKSFKTLEKRNKALFDFLEKNPKFKMSKNLDENQKANIIFYCLAQKFRDIVINAKNCDKYTNNNYNIFKLILSEKSKDLNTLKIMFDYVFNGDSEFSELFSEELIQNKELIEKIKNICGF